MDSLLVRDRPPSTAGAAECRSVSPTRGGRYARTSSRCLRGGGSRWVARSPSPRSVCRRARSRARDENCVTTSRPDAAGGAEVSAAGSSALAPERSLSRTTRTGTTVSAAADRRDWMSPRVAKRSTGAAYMSGQRVSSVDSESCFEPGPGGYSISRSRWRMSLDMRMSRGAYIEVVRRRRPTSEVPVCLSSAYSS